MVRGMSVLFITLLVVFIPSLKGLHVSGGIKGVPSGDKTKWGIHSEFLDKFGAQKGATFYVYGNAVENAEINFDKIPHISQMLLVVAPVNKWNDFINLAAASHNKLTDYSCKNTLLQPFENNDTCSSTTYYRVVPCNESSCSPSDQTKPPRNSTFVFKITPDKTEFYYIFFIYCARNWSTFDNASSCDWGASGKVDFDYSIFVTGNPYRERNPFYFQFPANMEGVLVSYLIFSFLYVILIPGHLFLNFKCYAKKHCKVHVLVWLFTVAVVMEGANILFGLIHYSVYSTDGRGVKTFFYFKDFFNLVGNWFLILVLILIAGGWQVTVKSIKWKFASFPVWAIYIFFAILYYIWEVVSTCVCVN